MRAGQTQGRTESLVESEEAQPETFLYPGTGRACVLDDQAAVWFYQDPLLWPGKEQSPGEHAGGPGESVLAAEAADACMGDEVRPVYLGSGR